MSDAMDVLRQNLLTSAINDALRANLRHKDPHSFTLFLNDREVPVTAGHLARSIDSVADGWTATIPWNPGADPALDAAVRFRSYASARVYLGANLALTGRLFSVENELDSGERSKNLEGASLTAVLVDSSITPDAMMQGYNESAYVWQGRSVWNFCNAICPAKGIGVRTDLGDAEAFYTKPFDVIETSFTETYGEVITRLAFQRGMLVTSDEYGNLFLTAPNTKQEPLCTIAEGDPIVTKWKQKVNGRELWHEYVTYSANGLGAMIVDSSTDPAVGDAYRSHAIIASLTDVGGAKNTSRFKRNQQIVKALTFPLPVVGWYTPRGDLWQPGKLVVVKSETLEVPKGFTFLIRSVDYEYSKAGCAATLNLIPPDAYGFEETPTTDNLWQ